MGLKAVEISFCLLILAFLTAHGKRPGRGHRQRDWDDPDDDLHSDIPPPSGQSESCVYTNFHGNRIYCELGCCIVGHENVCCTAPEEESDRKTHLAVFIILGTLLGLLVASLVVFIFIRVCKASKTKTRRTVPTAVPVKPAVRQSQPRQPTQPRHSRRLTQRPHVHGNSREQDIFTVTPILPSYADATKYVETNRPPPAYPLYESNIENECFRNFTSPPPPYAPNSLAYEEMRTSGGRKNGQYTEISLTDIQTSDRQAQL